MNGGAMNVTLICAENVFKYHYRYKFYVKKKIDSKVSNLNSLIFILNLFINIVDYL